jgi:plastocyanin
MLTTARRAVPLALLAAVAAGCGEDPSAAPTASKSDASSATTLLVRAADSGRGPWHFEVKRLKAEAGPITITFVNGDTFAHNLRVQRGAKCCFEPGNKDVGGTNTINAGAKQLAKLTLKPGRYVFLCTIGGHWSGDNGKMKGTLLVT